MYGLPLNFDHTVFLNLELIWVSFSQNTISFSFEDEIVITLESSYLYQVPNVLNEKQAIPITQTHLMQLIGHQVESVMVDNRKNLVLKFKNNHIITFFDDSENYESYKIQIGDREIII